MKVTKIKIADFHQFKDFELDLTYPKGHKKEGQPLDKVCFIGQSGTGKTTLLELIPKFLYDYDTPLIVKSGIESILENIEFSLTLSIVYPTNVKNEYATNVKFEKRKLVVNNVVTHPVKEIEIISREFSNQRKNNLEISYKQFQHEVHLNWLDNSAYKLIYLPANLSYNLDVDVIHDFKNKDIIDFSIDNVASVWNILIDKIQKYQEQELQIRQDISKTVEQASNDLNAIKKALKKLEDWKSTEFNPIQDVADNCLNRLLQPFKLRVKTELDIKSKDDIGFIKIEDYNGNEIPYGLWSTGTRQVILSALPLYLLKPKHTVILFDEPERSLYPDLQRQVVDYYSSLTDNCQFFYATHSPIIASGFEPWEIVELKFNKEGKIYRELYYDGENHVDNYKWNPRHMRWDDILQRIFDMEDDGSPERRKMLDELAEKHIRYKKMEKANTHNSPAGKQMLAEIQLLSKQLSHWD
jgi:predicted ATP-dependent endonuclease of OLD family